MANKDAIKAAILSVAGNPVSGAIADLADAMAQAVVDLDTATSSERSEKETRVTKPVEIR
jgi:hypothetical protein